MRVLGFMLILEAFFLMLCSLVSFGYGEEGGDAFLLTALGALGAGIVLRLAGSDHVARPTGKREIFLIVTLMWVILSAFGMFPFYGSGVVSKISDAFFESMSGFTTTGSTILNHIDDMPKGLLLWRGITQWLGGFGIIVFALLLLPMVGGNGVTFYNSFASGIVKNKFGPKIRQSARRFGIIYFGITVTLVALLWAGPMNFFDALCHAFSTVSTGGFSTKQAGVGYWHSAYVEYVLCAFMFVGGINFTLIYSLCKGRLKKAFMDEEFRWYVLAIVVSSAAVAAVFHTSGQMGGWEEPFRKALFQVVSMVTTTGFHTVDFSAWGVFFALVMCMLMLFCSSSGSASGGLKMVRMVILSKNTVNEFKRQVHPNAILPVRLNGNVVPMDVVGKILAFAFLYLLILGMSFLVLGLSGMNFEESVSSAISCMNNVGPALGSINANGHFAAIPDVSKWYLSFLMLVGRLEIFTVLSLFMPAFWKR